MSRAMPAEAAAAAAAPQRAAAPAPAETPEQKAARERAAAERAAARGAAIASHPRISRWWPHALYHYDYEKRGDGGPGAPKQPFLVEASLTQILAAERARLLARCATIVR